MSYWFARLWHVVGSLAIYVGSATLTFKFFLDITPATFWWFPLAAIGCFEYGVWHWSTYEQELAENAPQAVTAIAMFVLSILGVAFTSGMEFFRMIAPIFHLDVGWMNYGLFLLPAMFFLQVLGVQLVKKFSDDHIALWQLAFDRGGERPEFPKIPKPSWLHRRAKVKEALPASEQKQLDGPTEPVEAVTLSNFSDVSKKKRGSRTQTNG